MMNMSNNTDRISIQVGLSGYSFKLDTAGSSSSSSWQTADRVFTSPELQAEYESVEISVFTPKCALVPEQFYDESAAYDLLNDVAEIEKDDVISAIEVPEFSSVLIYSSTIGETLSKVISETVRKADGNKVKPLPELYYMLARLAVLTDYNKIVASYADGYLYLVIAQGKTLLLCNSYAAQDFTTAEYFIFLAMKKLQLNPEVSSIYFRTSLTEDEELSLYRYFKSVEKI